MKTTIHYKNIPEPSRPELEARIRDLSWRHLERHLARFSPDLVQLHVELEKSNHRNLHRVKLRLWLPGGTLVSGEESDELVDAMLRSYAELERQLERHISHLRREHSWRRKERREALRKLKTVLADRPRAEAEAFGELVQPLLPSLQNFVQREMRYLQARGDLGQDYPTVNDVVDEILARAHQQLHQRPENATPQEWLYQIALEVLKQEVSRRQAEEGRWVSLETKVPWELAHPGENEDEAIYEYYQPDEQLKVEDMVPVAERSPEEAVSEKEARLYVALVLSQLPNKWRRAVLLAQVEGLPRATVARMLGGVSVKEIGRWLEHADAFVRARLEEAGIKPAASDETGDSFVPGWLKPAPELGPEFVAITRGRDKRDEQAAADAQRRSAQANS